MLLLLVAAAAVEDGVAPIFKSDVALSSESLFSLPPRPVAATPLASSGADVLLFLAFGLPAGADDEAPTARARAPRPRAAWPRGLGAALATPRAERAATPLATTCDRCAHRPGGMHARRAPARAPRRPPVGPTN
mmetsp:Transcript_1053/g.4139  ORF Transcript_1053/g.4139 Transcript_1053/m.4139 type:complete len:134 (-) Transcript_1053:81-482(-)